MDIERLPMWKSIMIYIVWPILKSVAIFGVCYMLKDVIILAIIALPLFGSFLAGALKDGANIN